MGWIPSTTTFYYGQRSKCADLPELLPIIYYYKRECLEKQSLKMIDNDLTRVLY